jgi:rhamnulokinase
VLPEAAADAGLQPGLPVIAVGSHDTASAVAAVPAAGSGFAYISCGTWSLVGMELDQPVLSEASRRANFTNEAGIDGTIRYLTNVMGLWLMQESLRAWSGADSPASFGQLLPEAAQAAPLRCIIDSRRPQLPGAGRHAGQDHRGLPAGRPAGTVRPGRDRSLHHGQPGTGVPAGNHERPGAVRQARRHHPYRRRRLPE